MKLFLIGFMGSGKSHLGKELAKALNYDFIDLDAYLEQREGETITTIFETKGADYFRTVEQKYLKQLASLTQTVIATGGGTPCFFDNIEWINQQGQSVYLNPTVNVLAHRLQSEMGHRPLLAGESKHSLKQFLHNKLKERSAFYEKAHYIIPITAPTQNVTQQIISLINNI